MSKKKTEKFLSDIRGPSKLKKNKTTISRIIKNPNATETTIVERKVIYHLNTADKVLYKKQETGE